MFLTSPLIDQAISTSLRRLFALPRLERFNRRKTPRKGGIQSSRGSHETVRLLSLECILTRKSLTRKSLTSKSLTRNSCETIRHI